MRASGVAGGSAGAAVCPSTGWPIRSLESAIGLVNLEAAARFRKLDLHGGRILATVLDDLTYDSVLERDGVRVSRSPWGPDDDIGRLNWITPESSLALLGRAGGTRIFDLSVDY